MSITIRPFTPEDYPALTEVRNAVYPDYPETEDEIRRHDEKRNPKCRYRRWVGLRDGRVVAEANYAQSESSYHPRKFHLHVGVRPEDEGRGIGAALYNQVLAALAPFEPISVSTEARDDMPRSVRFLRDRGFEERMRDWESRLDVRAFDPSPFAGAEERVLQQGIEIRTLKELQADPECYRKMYEMEWAIEEDVPRSEPEFTPPEFERWQDKMLSNPNFLPVANFIAVVDGQYAGLSALWKSEAGDYLDTGLTGVRREFRRRGIALALKLRAVAFARDYGSPEIRTWNESRNRGMLSINEALGFVKQPAWISFRKTLAEEEG